MTTDHYCKGLKWQAKGSEVQVASIGGSSCLRPSDENHGAELIRIQNAPDLAHGEL